MAYRLQVVGQGEPFKLTSIVREEPPAGAEGSGWHCYVISQGENTITGHRQGNLKSVTKEVEELLVGLNQRRLLKTGRVHLTPPFSPSIKKT